MTQRASTTRMLARRSKPSWAQAARAAIRLTRTVACADLQNDPMLDGPTVARALLKCGVTHVVWIPDSSIGTWEAALLAEPGIRLIRASREGEAIAIAGGLWLGGRK